MSQSRESRRIRFAAFILLSTAFAALLAAAAPAPRPQARLRIAVNATTIESFPVFAAAGQGVEVVRSPNGRNAMAQLVAGSVDAATGSETQALLNSVADPRLRIVLTLAECRYRIVARRSAGIKSIADLRGKAVAVTLNTSSVYFLTRMLATARLSASDVRVVNLEGPEMPAALRNRTVDAVAMWEPHAQHSLEALGADGVTFIDGAAYTEYFNLNTRTDVLNDPAKRVALTALVKEIGRVSERLRSQPGTLIPSLAPEVGLPPQTVQAVWPQFRFPADLPAGLRPVLPEVETWVAEAQKRKPRSAQELSGLIDASVLGR